MSSILKALRRLEEEQSRATPRPLREEVTGPALDARPARRPTAWMPAALGVLGAGCLVLAARLFWDRMGRETPMPVAAPVASRPPSSTSPTSPGELRAGPTHQPGVAGRAAGAAPEPTRPRAGTTPPLPRVAAATSPAPARRPLEATPRPVARASRETPSTAPEPRRRAAPAPSPAPAPRAVPAPPAAPASRVSASRPSPAPAPAPPPARPAIAASDARPAASAPAPEPVVERPPAVSAYPKLPGFRVTRTVWHPHSDRRLAFVRHDAQQEPLEVREGQVLEGGAVVLQIDPGAVVFLHRGNEIRRAVGGP